MPYRALLRSAVCVVMSASLSACLGGPVAGFDRPSTVTTARPGTPVADPELVDPVPATPGAPAVCVPADETCDGVDNDCDGLVDELDRCHAAELVCGTAPTLGDPARAAWTTTLHSAALVVAPVGVSAAGEAAPPAVYYRVSLPGESILAVRTARALTVLAGVCDVARPQEPVASTGCGDEHIALFALPRGEYTLRFEGERADAVDATVQAVPVPAASTGYHLRTWDEMADAFYVGAVPASSAWAPPCGEGARPWAAEMVYGCAVPSTVQVDVRGASSLRLASVQGDDDAVCVAPGSAALAVDPRDLVHRFVVSATEGSTYGGLWVTASHR